MFTLIWDRTETKPIVSYCANPIPCACLGPGPVQCEWAIVANHFQRFDGFRATISAGVFPRWINRVYQVNVINLWVILCDTRHVQHAMVWNDVKHSQYYAHEPSLENTKARNILISPRPLREIKCTCVMPFGDKTEQLQFTLCIWVVFFGHIFELIRKHEENILWNHVNTNWIRCSSDQSSVCSRPMLIWFPMLVFFKSEYGQSVNTECEIQFQ